MGRGRGKTWSCRGRDGRGRERALRGARNKRRCLGGTERKVKRSRNYGFNLRHELLFLAVVLSKGSEEEKKRLV